MSIPTELELNTAIVNIVSSVTGAGKVYSSYILPADALKKGEIDLVTDDNGLFNVIFVERVNVTTIVNSMQRPIKDIHTYFLWFYYGYDSRDENNRSGPAFQLRVENTRLAFRVNDWSNAAQVLARHNLSFGPNVTHSGLTVQNQMQLNQEYESPTHRAVMQLVVSVDLNC